MIRTKAASCTAKLYDPHFSATRNQLSQRKFSGLLNAFFSIIW